MRAVPRGRWLLFFAIAAFGTLVDLLTKYWAFARLGSPFGLDAGRIYWLWEGRFGFQTSLNEGALWGIGQGAALVFAGLSVFAAVGVLLWFVFGKAYESRYLTVTLGMVMAGILGNLYDRLGLPGITWPAGNPAGHPVGATVHAVRDWVLMMFGTYHWPNYNIADALLLCGATLLVWHAVFLDRSSAVASESKAG